MKTTVQSLIQQAITKLQQAGELPTDKANSLHVERTKNRDHGDFASNVALTLAKSAKTNPRSLAQKLVDALPTSDLIYKTEIAGPGFINFFLSEKSSENVIQQILQEKKHYGRCNLGEGKRIHLEYVSSNPTGPLHVGHGRGAAYGSCVANLLQAAGYQVHREYYVNDIGRQMLILTLSIWIRYLQLHGEKPPLPSNAYQGEYVIEIAQQPKNKKGSLYLKNNAELQKKLSLESSEDKEAYIDAYIQTAIDFLGENHFQEIKNAGLDAILENMRADLEEFGVSFDQWFHESELKTRGMLEQGIEQLKKQGHTYEREGALWFRATDFGDEKDRVLIRKNGHTTYFASDVAYHLYKYRQNYDEIIDIFGADHHGYISRLRAFLQGLGEDPDRLKVLMVQFAVLYRGTEKVTMSTRTGEFVPLRELREEVSNDAARYFYIMRKPEQHLDFDLNLAKSKSSENPVYYIQYAHARICSIWRQLTEQNLQFQEKEGLEHLALLKTTHEKQLINTLSRYPEIIEASVLNYDPHLLAYYLYDLANDFHTYYNAERFIVEEKALRNARLCLITAAQQVLINGLTLLGLSTPEKM
jgi:arginyl-tRNA synthetase